ncbi:MAG: DsbA family protein, partial [Longimicrobiales bacterium]
FEGCLRSDMHARTVTANMRLGEVLGVSGTPTVMVSEGRGMANRLMSNDFDSIREAVDEAIEDQDAQDGEAGTGEVDGSDGGQDGGSGGGQ